MSVVKVDPEMTWRLVLEEVVFFIVRMMAPGLTLVSHVAGTVMAPVVLTSATKLVLDVARGIVDRIGKERDREMRDACQEVK